LIDSEADHHGSVRGAIVKHSGEDGVTVRIGQLRQHDNTERGAKE
jgi:hypothetical protein